MTFTKKFKEFKNFYIFFFISLLFINTIVISKLYAISFKITDIEVSEDFDLGFSKKKVFDKAFREAFVHLISVIVTSEDKSKIEKTSLKTIKSLINTNNTNFKGVGQPLRIALTGSKFGPVIYDILCSLGKSSHLVHSQFF